MAEVIMFLGCDWPKRRQRTQRADWGHWAVSSQLTSYKDPVWRLLLLFFLPFSTLFPSQTPVFIFCFLTPEARGLPSTPLLWSLDWRARLDFFNLSDLEFLIDDSWSATPFLSPSPPQARVYLSLEYMIHRMFIFYIHILTQHWLSLT